MVWIPVDRPVSQLPGRGWSIYHWKHSFFFTYLPHSLCTESLTHTCCDFKGKSCALRSFKGHRCFVSVQEGLLSRGDPQICCNILKRCLKTLFLNTHWNFMLIAAYCILFIKRNSLLTEMWKLVFLPQSQAYKFSERTHIMLCAFLYTKKKTYFYHTYNIITKLW